MSSYRIEKDLLGEKEIVKDCLWGIHTQRAIENFPLNHEKVHPELINAFGLVKLAAIQTNNELGFIEDNIAEAIERACEELAEGRLDSQFPTNALQGGAGTSTNMNVNEVLANRALAILGKPLGDYETISPLEHINLHQSTNDTYPTALKVASIKMLRKLEREIVSLVETFQHKEKEFADVVKVGRTQMQDAVLTTLGREMSAYTEAFSRDRWRVYKCEERLRVINLGGTAIGTGLLAPRQYIFRVTEKLQQLTGLGLARAENLVEATQNTDCFVEVSGILKALASNLFKVANDLRFISSGPEAGIGEITLPERQAGSSIMPGKVNPVIPEAVMQAAIKSMANDSAITLAVSMGNLELNAFMPIIAQSLLDTLQMLTNACSIFRQYCIEGISANRDTCKSHVHDGTSATTALIEKISYYEAQEIAETARKEKITLKQAAINSGKISEDEYLQLTSPEAVTKLGSRNVVKKKEE
jgi:aspartate ammonia-lyase